MGPSAVPVPAERAAPPDLLPRPDAFGKRCLERSHLRHVLSADPLPELAIHGRTDMTVPKL